MIALLLLATIGHGFFWVALINRSHAVAIPRPIIHAVTYIAFLAAGIIPLGVAWLLYRAAVDNALANPIAALPREVSGYLAVCAVLGAWAAAQWSWSRFRWLAGRPAQDRCTKLSRLRPGAHEAAPSTCDACLVARLPGNEILGLEEIDRSLVVARLPTALSGLSILHISDLHFTGLVGKWYFEELVRRCNLRQPDLVALTGDILDEEECIAWIPDTLAKLRARHGVYFILGNHDRRVNSKRLRKTLERGGMVDLGGRFVEVQLRGQPVLLAGNEVPWFSPAADFSQAPPSSLQGGPVRIVLAHSPDQLAWARRNEVDLVLAGHTHGGQICLPAVGPIFAPCLHGVRHARGVFSAPPTVLHVTKGVSAQFPVRFRAAPEAVLLGLRSPRGEARSVTGLAAASSLAPVP